MWLIVILVKPPSSSCGKKGGIHYEESFDASLRGGRAASDESEGAFKIMNEKDLMEHVDKVPIVVVIVYAPWCGHCKAAMPNFLRDAKIHNTGDKIHLCAANGDEADPEFLKKHGVRGFPTLLVFYNGEKLGPDNEIHQLMQSKGRTNPADVAMKLLNM